MHVKNPGTLEDNMSMTSQFSEIKTHGQRTSRQGNKDYDKHTKGIKNPYNKKQENRKF